MTENSKQFGKLKYYQIGEFLGKGGQGQVNKAIHKPTNRKCAIKKMPTNFLDITKVLIDAQDLKSFSHENIVNCIDYFYSEDKMYFYLVTELAENGDVFTKILKTQNHRLPENEAKEIIIQLLRAVNYLHNTKGFAHRDIKPQNILDFGNGLYKLTDFELSKTSLGYTQLRTYVGTPYFIAPEVTPFGSPYTKECDLWSVGMTTIFLLNKDFYQKAYENAINGRPAINLITDVNYFQGISNEAIDFINQCLKISNQRINVQVL